MISSDCKLRSAQSNQSSLTLEANEVALSCGILSTFALKSSVYNLETKNFSKKIYKLHKGTLRDVVR